MKEILKNVRKTNPLIHNITNYVTANDCANILLACGASPIMADDLQEVSEITSICNGLNINIGTLNERTVASMIEAGKQANKLHNTVVLDPVGVGASTFRTKTAINLLNQVHFSVIRGNISEIKALASGSFKTKGVDADISDKVTCENLDQTMHFASEFSKKTNSTIVITGEIDLICDKNTCYIIKNGHSMMSTVTGTGCMLSAIIGAFVSANPHDITKAAATAVACMGICGELAFERLTAQDGNATYRNFILDSMYNLDENILEKRVKYELKSL